MSASLPLMLSTMIGVVECSRICCQTSKPSHRGITRSSKMRSGSSRSNAAKASTPSLAVVILYPLVDREWLTAAIIPGSSSTSKMCSLAWPIVSLPLVHLHLTFSSLVCILSLKGRQEHCPFTTRLRVLKLVSLFSCPAAIDNQCRACHESCLVRGEVERGIRDLIRSPHTSDRLASVELPARLILVASEI